MPGTTSGARYLGPHSAMKAMNQSGQPRDSGKRGPMWPAPLTSGGLALEEVTCRGWGPHLQYSFLIQLASLSESFSFVYGCGEKIELKSPKLHTQGPPGPGRP